MFYYFLISVQAVMETALSRAALFGATAVVPNLLVLLFQRSVTLICSFVFVDKIAPVGPTIPHRSLHYRSRALQRYSRLVAPLRQMTTVFVMGLMIPISFSLYPQLGTVRLKILQCCNVFLGKKSADIYTSFLFFFTDKEEKYREGAECWITLRAVILP